MSRGTTAHRRNGRRDEANAGVARIRRVAGDRRRVGALLLHPPPSHAARRRWAANGWDDHSEWRHGMHLRRVSQRRTGVQRSARWALQTSAALVADCSRHDHRHGLRIQSDSESSLSRPVDIRQRALVFGCGNRNPGCGPQSTPRPGCRAELYLDRHHRSVFGVPRPLRW